MEELLKICKTMLDNVDLDIMVESPSGAITLDFVVGGSLERVILRCSDYTRLQVVKPAEHRECFFVGETHIELITSRTKLQELLAEDSWCSIGGAEIDVGDTKVRPMFHVRCDGGLMLDIVCGVLEWKIDDESFQSIPTPETTV